MSDLKLQNARKNPNKPSVVSDFPGIWWAQVHDLNGELHHELCWSQPEALTKAREYAALVEKQRLIAALATSPSKAVGP